MGLKSAVDIAIDNYQAARAALDEKGERHASNLHHLVSSEKALDEARAKHDEALRQLLEALPNPEVT